MAEPMGASFFDSEVLSCRPKGRIKNRLTLPNHVGSKVDNGQLNLGTGITLLIYEIKKGLTLCE
jgi:hypothetical protein